MTPESPRPIEVLAFPRVQLLDVTGPLQVFASANDHLVGRGDAPLYSTSVVSRGGLTVVASAGVQLVTAPLPSTETGIDTLLVAGGQGVDDASTDPLLLQWLGARASRSRRFGSVCTGAFLLAAAGLLDGRRVVTHWSLCEQLARRYPSVHVESDPIFVHDDPVWTSAGVTAGIDLALAMVEADLGRAVALAVARYLVVFLKRPGGQAQFSTTLALQVAEDRFGALHRWIEQHLDQTLTLPLLAERAAMSERNFSRRYRQATGTAPGRAVERLRIEAARRLLSESDLPIKSIASRCGFGSEETMRRSFQRLLSTTPQDYRCRFGR